MGQFQTFHGHFYPRPPRGGRPVHRTVLLFCWIISIHALREEGDRQLQQGTNTVANFYPRPPRGGRHSVGQFQALHGNFYPRPPRGGRPKSHSSCWSCRVISIHALREEGDNQDKTYLISHITFLSTPSARRATAGRGKSRPAFQISIHALREEGDVSAWRKSSCFVLFLSTPSARRAPDSVG